MGKVSSAELSRALRAQLGNLTQAELAAKLLVSRNYISQIEAELKSPSKRLRAQLEQMLTESAQAHPKVSTSGSDSGVERKAAGLEEGPQELYGEAEQIKKELRHEFELLLIAAKGRRDRLGWIATQMREHLARPKHWLTSDEINRLARELAARASTGESREVAHRDHPGQREKSA